ncbi:hypothetical protein [Candidatus Nitrotoga sp. 1052]|uniref:hypothetical protein n=1 Tax=Candidatus Nitrotoga sp. 1052 TaxID=2886964 RepID=UPI001EF41E06|nr:hypothetical protein [Candidatus Nitrotoga sp. 1052]
MPSIDGMSIDELTRHLKGIGWKSALDRLQGVTARNRSNVCKSPKHDDKNCPWASHRNRLIHPASYQSKMGT